MSLSPAVIDALVAAGATVEQLAAAVKADMAEAAARLEDKRAKDAARQRKSRASRNVTVTPRDNCDAPPNDIYSNPPGSPPVEAKASTAPRGKNRNRTGDRLPDDWEPKPFVGETAAMVAAWPAGMMERQLAQFRDHYAKTPGTKGRSLDWDASLRTWLRNADQWMGERNGHGQTNRGNHSGGRMGGHQPASDGLSPTTRAALRVFGPDPGHPH